MKIMSLCVAVLLAAVPIALGDGIPAGVDLAKLDGWDIVLPADAIPQ